MQVIYCPNCGKRSGFKRALGFGTYFMVVITFGLWLLVIPFYPTRCINCGLTSRAAFWESLSIGERRVLAVLGLIAAVLCLVWVSVSRHASSSAKSEDSEPAVASISPHEQRLADLRKKREDLAWSVALEREKLKHLSQQGTTLSMDRFADPGERDYLMQKMDEEGQRAEQLLEQLRERDAEIAKEEGLPSGRPAPASDAESTEVRTHASSDPVAPSEPDSAAFATSAPAQTAPAASSTSGVLCNGTINVPQNYQMVFQNLPSDRLKLTFDHDAWQPTIRRQPDGRQTLVMQSVKAGFQTRCEIEWEIER